MRTIENAGLKADEELEHLTCMTSLSSI